MSEKIECTCRESTHDPEARCQHQLLINIANSLRKICENLPPPLLLNGVEAELDRFYRCNQFLFEQVEEIIDQAYSCLPSSDRTPSGKTEDDQHLVLRRLLAGYRSLILLFDEDERIQLRRHFLYGAGAVMRHLDLQFGQHRANEIPYMKDQEVAQLRQLLYNNFPERENKNAEAFK